MVFTFLVPAHPGSPGQRAIKRVCVCIRLVSQHFVNIDVQPLMDEFEEFSSTMSELNEQSAAVLFPSTSQPPAWHPTRRRQYSHSSRTLAALFL